MTIVNKTNRNKEETISYIVLGNGDMVHFDLIDEVSNFFNNILLFSVLFISISFLNFAYLRRFRFENVYFFLNMIVCPYLLNMLRLLKCLSF